MTHRSRNLTDAQIERLRRIWMSGKYAYMIDMAKDMQIPYTTLRDIVRRKNWLAARPIKENPTPTVKGGRVALDRAKVLAYLDRRWREEMRLHMARLILFEGGAWSGANLFTRRKKI